ncbi:GspH/FimT family pseudopilin [Paraglaciecola sp. L3A3]|uniref:GspH/FimT family pseudopilin n=1 Tax=Paraglaciecola sp. L3A3 TaxID=2686358 RepID=UPI00131DD172|nr:GspH/FimT family protein [Paraglaciecola sp. L3A3]
MLKFHGLTLLELLISISIIILLITLGSPAFDSIQRNIQLKSVAENVYFALQKARSAAIAQQADITSTFQDGSNWCIGNSDIGKCDCKVLANCTVNGVEQTLSSVDYSLISINEIKFGKDSIAVFDGVRGLSIGHAGSVIFSDGKRRLKLILSNMGRVRICGLSEDVGGYKKC